MPAASAAMRFRFLKVKRRSSAWSSFQAKSDNSAGFADEMELHRVDCLSSHGALDNHEFLTSKAAEFAEEPLIPPPLITGRDLIAMGHRPGPGFGPILEAIQTLQLEGALSNSEEALEWVRRNHPAPGDGARGGVT